MMLTYFIVLSDSCKYIHPMSSQPNQNTPVGVTLPEGADFAALIDHIRDGDQTAVQELTRLFSRGIRFLLSRQLQPAHVEFALQSTLTTVIRAVKAKEILEPEQLVRFVLTTLKGQRANFGQQQRRIQVINRPDERSRKDPTLYECSCALEHADEIIANTVREMSKTEREALRRYYLNGETPEAIQSSLNLSVAEFQFIIMQIKSRLRSFKGTGKSSFNRYLAAQNGGVL